MFFSTPATNGSVPDTRVMRVALCLVVGMSVIQQLPTLPGVWVLLVFCVLGFVLLNRGLLVVGALIIGFAWAGIYGSLLLRDKLPTTTGRLNVLVEGQVLGIPTALDRGRRFDFRVTKVMDPPDLPIPETLRLNWYETDDGIKAGQYWRLRLSLRPPRGLANPGTFDYEQWLFAQEIGAIGYVRKSVDNHPVEAQFSPFVFLQSWRQATHDLLDIALQGSPRAGLLKALTMGDDDDITRSQWEILRRTGTAHLIAISGSHIGMVAAFVFFLARYGWASLGILRWSPSNVAAVIGLTVALFYSALAGFSVPTQRALIMIAIAMAAIVYKRHQRISHVLALALIGVVLWDPMAVLSPGFWLSYGAVGLIAYTLSGRLHAVGQGFRGLVTINWVTALGLAPVLLLFFGQVSLISPLANLFAVPLLGTVLIPVCLVGTLCLSLFPPVGKALFTLADWIMQQSWTVLEWFSALQFAQWRMAHPPLVETSLALAGVVLLLAPRGIPSRWLGGVMLLPALLYHPQRLAPGTYRVTLLDVGQGLATVIETRHKTLIFDTGERLSPEFDMGSAVIEPYLRHRSINRIDALVVSHDDNDHIGGAHSLLAAFPVDKTYSSAPDKLPETQVTPCFAGQQWEWDGIRFEMLGPATLGTKENNNSCVLKVSGAGGATLMTGDIEAEGEYNLLQRYASKLSSKLLVVPHHGSKTSSTDGFLSAVNPEWALIPAGYLNRFGFPHPTIVARYAARHIQTMTVGESGAITMDMQNPSTSNQPLGYRAVHPRYWSVD